MHNVMTFCVRTPKKQRLYTLCSWQQMRTPCSYAAGAEDQFTEGPMHQVCSELLRVSTLPWLCNVAVQRNIKCQIWLQQLYWLWRVPGIYSLTAEKPCVLAVGFIFLLFIYLFFGCLEW